VDAPGATHVSCTVEMANLSLLVDVAVVDEYQLIGERDRGWAWTRAILGLPARTIHLCGDPSAVGIVKQLLSATGDELEVRDYARLSPLTVSRKIVSKATELQSVRENRLPFPFICQVLLSLTCRFRVGLGTV